MILTVDRIARLSYLGLIVRADYYDTSTSEVECEILSGIKGKVRVNVDSCLAQPGGFSKAILSSKVLPFEVYYEERLESQQGKIPKVITREWLRKHNIYSPELLDPEREESRLWQHDAYVWRIVQELCEQGKALIVQLLTHQVKGEQLELGLRAHGIVIEGLKIRQSYLAGWLTYVGDERISMGKVLNLVQTMSGQRDE